MSKSDAQRRSYLADQMTMGERVEALENKVAELNFAAQGCLSQRNELAERIEDVGSEDSQYFHDELRSLGRRLGKLEKASNPGMTHFVGDDCAGGHRASPTECGRIVVNANEWDRLNRLDYAVMCLERMGPGTISFRDKAGWDRWCTVLKEMKL